MPNHSVMAHATRSTIQSSFVHGSTSPSLASTLAAPSLPRHRPPRRTPDIPFPSASVLASRRMHLSEEERRPRDGLAKTTVIPPYSPITRTKVLVDATLATGRPLNLPRVPGHHYHNTHASASLAAPTDHSHSVAPLRLRKREGLKANSQERAFTGNVLGPSNTEPRRSASLQRREHIKNASIASHGVVPTAMPRSVEVAAYIPVNTNLERGPNRGVQGRQLSLHSVSPRSKRPLPITPTSDIDEFGHYKVSNGKNSATWPGHSQKVAFGDRVQAPGRKQPAPILRNAPTHTIPEKTPTSPLKNFIRRIKKSFSSSKEATVSTPGQSKSTTGTKHQPATRLHYDRKVYYARKGWTV